MTRRSGKTLRMEGFQKPQVTESKSVGLALLRDDGRMVVCSCGWSFTHGREKIRGNRGDKHAERKHGGRAGWL